MLYAGRSDSELSYDRVLPKPMILLVACEPGSAVSVASYGAMSMIEYRPILDK